MTSEDTDRLWTTLEKIRDGQIDTGERLVRIEQKFDDLPCSTHAESIEAVERAISKQNVLASVLGAVAGGLVLAVKWVSGK